MPPDLILTNGRFTTLDRANPNPEAVAIAGGRFSAVGDAADILPTRGPATRVLDLGGRRAIPGLIDSHMHVIRGGLNYNMELRWDGVPTLADAMAMLKRQAAVTPPPQWVRVVGGFSEHQFAQKRLPTLEELNAVAPDTPVFILHLYDRALLNRAALRAVGYTKDSQDPPGGRIERDKAGNPTGLLLAKPNALILYATLAKGPKLPPEYQRNSTRHFMRELNRLGITSVIDAGGGFQNYPDDYEIIRQLHADDELTVRIAYNLFTQNRGGERADFERWSTMLQPREGDDLLRHNGAGEMLVFSATDFEDFREPRPDLPPSLEGDLDGVVRLLNEKRWPFRIHATYDESITRILDVYEKVDREVPFDGLRWFIDHAAEFIFVPSDQVTAKAAELGAIPFDVEGVELSHVGPLCTFDAILKKYSLADPALDEIAVIVRGADTDRLDLAPQAAGLLAISLGLSRNYADDHEQLVQGMIIYDALYSWAKYVRSERHTWNPQRGPTPIPAAV